MRHAVHYLVLICLSKNKRENVPPRGLSAVWI